MNETLSEIIRVSWSDRYRQNTETLRKIVKPLCKRKEISQLTLGLKIQSCKAALRRNIYWQLLIVF